LGTLDGANVEISDLVGMDHCIIFGMRVNEVDAFNKSGLYSPWDMYHNDERIKNIMDSLIDGSWSDGNHDTFRQIFDEIMQHRDEYFVLKDFAPYVQAQEDMAKLYEDRTQWVKSAIINMAHSGFFSTDRTIEQYNADIWHLEKLNQDD
jgi:starch phosphorylase